jgi:uncharacterized protein YodC (DUF2158 family)
MPVFNVGDIVRLRSGSPRLTVEGDAERNGYVRVTWIGYGTNAPHFAEYRPEMLVLERAANVL